MIRFRFGFGAVIGDLSLPSPAVDRKLQPPRAPGPSRLLVHRSRRPESSSRHGPLPNSRRLIWRLFCGAMGSGT